MSNGESLSPPVNTYFKERFLSLVSLTKSCTSAVEMKLWVIPLTLNNSNKLHGFSRILSSRTKTEAPAERYGHTSHPNASNPTPAIEVALLAEETSKAWMCHEIKFTRDESSIITPLGFPVDPEV